MKTSQGYIEDEVYGQRLLISVNADPRELQSNIRAARAILHSFADVSIMINAHTMSFGHKNPPSMDNLATAKASWGKKA